MKSCILTSAIHRSQQYTDPNHELSISLMLCTLFHTTNGSWSIIRNVENQETSIQLRCQFLTKISNIEDWCLHRFWISWADSLLLGGVHMSLRAGEVRPGGPWSHSRGYKAKIAITNGYQLFFFINDDRWLTVVLGEHSGQRLLGVVVH